VLVAGEETNESLRTWLRAAAAHQSSESEGGRERHRTQAGRGNEECSGRKWDAAEGVAGRMGECRHAAPATAGPVGFFFFFFLAQRERTRWSFLWAVFLFYFFFLSLLIFFILHDFRSILFIDTINGQ
jgi:hypothetical protein